MTLSDAERRFLSRALVLAADKYVGFAVDSGGERLKQQFYNRACEARRLAIVFGDSDLAIVDAPKVDLKKVVREARRITHQQFIDTIRERNGVSQEGFQRDPTCVLCDAGDTHHEH